MDRQSSGTHEPPVERCRRDSTLLVEQPGRKDVRGSHSVVIGGHPLTSLLIRQTFRVSGTSARSSLLKGLTWHR
jgi:hypothetical protein